MEVIDILKIHKIRTIGDTVCFFYPLSFTYYIEKGFIINHVLMSGGEIHYSISIKQSLWAESFYKSIRMVLTEKSLNWI